MRRAAGTDEEGGTDDEGSTGQHGRGGGHKWQDFGRVT